MKSILPIAALLLGLSQPSYSQQCVGNTISHVAMQVAKLPCGSLDALFEGITPKKPENHTYDDALKFFDGISKNLERRGYSVIDTWNYFPDSIKSKALDCFDASLLYISAGNKAKLPVHGVMSRNHMLVAYLGRDFVLYYDTTARMPVDVRKLEKEHNIPVDAVARNVYHSIMSDDDLLAAVHLEEAMRQKKLKNLDSALGHCSKAISLNHVFAEAYVKRDLLYAQMQMPGLAERDSRTAISLDKDHWLGYYGLALSHRLLGITRDEFMALGESLRLAVLSKEKDLGFLLEELGDALSRIQK